MPGAQRGLLPPAMRSALERTGQRRQSISTAVRSALIDAARHRAAASVRAEAEALAADEQDRAEAVRCCATWRGSVRGECIVYVLRAKPAATSKPVRGMRSWCSRDELPLSTWLVAPTSTSARAASFRPEVEIAGRDDPSTRHGAARRPASTATHTLRDRRRAAVSASVRSNGHRHDPTVASVIPQHEGDDGLDAADGRPDPDRVETSAERPSPGSRAAPGSGTGGAAWTWSWTRSAGSARG